jgi:hypothetical protein
VGLRALSAGDAARIRRRRRRPCVILAASSRRFQKDGPWGYYTVDETARRYGACPDVETQDGEVAYANVPPAQESRYRDGVLPD